MTQLLPDQFSDALSSNRDSRNSRRRKEFPESFATNIPKRIFQWLYSFSLIIFIILTAAFVVVTPLDIVVQTYGAPSTGIKMFIIIAACAIFLVLLVLVYISRLYYSRDVVNQIPSKSVYVPLEKNDLNSDVLKYIENHLTKCVGDIKVKAGPLHNKDALFNYPGLSPPQYIQERNVRLGYAEHGTLLPPNCLYEDVIDGLALRTRFDGVLITNFRIPTSFTFREIIISIFEGMSDVHRHKPEAVADLQRAIKLYEKFRFGPDLITERELVTFLKLMETFSANFSKFNPSANNRHIRGNSMSGAPFASLLNRGGYSDDEYRGDIESLVVPYHPSVYRTNSRLTRTSTRNSVSSSGSSTPRIRASSVSTQGSVIKNRLAYRLTNNSYRTLEEDEETSLHATSGYLSDSEQDDGASCKVFGATT